MDIALELNYIIEEDYQRFVIKAKDLTVKMTNFVKYLKNNS